MDEIGIVKIKNQRHYERVRSYFECLGFDTRGEVTQEDSYRGKYVEGIYCGIANGGYDEVFESDFEFIDGGVNIIEIPNDFEVYSTRNVEAILNKFYEDLLKRKLLSWRGAYQPTIINDFISNNELGLIKKQSHE